MPYAAAMAQHARAIRPFLEQDEQGESGLVLSSHAAAVHNAELPLTVKDAARFLGVSAQTVYLWVERKQIPHLRVMGRNIRFLKSDLEPFRTQFKQEVENGKAK
jgi:excisionase family DNA binding protein